MTQPETGINSESPSSFQRAVLAPLDLLGSVTPRGQPQVRQDTEDTAEDIDGEEDQRDGDADGYDVRPVDIPFHLGCENGRVGTFPVSIPSFSISFAFGCGGGEAAFGLSFNKAFFSSSVAGAAASSLGIERPFCGRSSRGLCGILHTNSTDPSGSERPIEGVLTAIGVL